MSKKTALIRDLDLSLTPHPITKDITFVEDGAAIKRSIRLVIFMRFYEIAYLPDVGCDARSMVFQINDNISVAHLKGIVRNVLTNYQKNVTILSLEAKNEEKTLKLTLLYRLLNQENPEKIDIFLERIR